MAREFPHDTSGHIERYACKDPDDSDQNDPCAGVEDTFIDWNARGLAEKVTVGDSKTDTTPTARDSFRYGPDGARHFKKSEWAVDLRHYHDHEDVAQVLRGRVREDGDGRAATRWSGSE